MLPALSDVVYAAMPADERRESNHMGVPYTVSAAACVSPPSSLVLTVAVEPVSLAALNQLAGTLTEYRRVRLLTPRSVYELKLRSGAPASDAVMVSGTLDTSESPYSS